MIHSYSYLGVQSAVPLELAKVLREDDLVEVEARVKDVFTSPEGVNLVVVSPRVSKLSDERAMQLREASTDKESRLADTPIVNIPKAYLRYATQLIKECDNNENGVLEIAEWNKSSSAKPDSSPDTDGDGRITAEELALYKFRGN